MSRKERYGSAILVQRLRKRVDELAAAETRLRSTVDHALDGIITINDQGTIESFNPAAEQIFGLHAAEALGQSVNMLLPAADRKRRGQQLVDSLKRRDSRTIGSVQELTGLRRDGTTFPLQMAVSQFALNRKTYFTAIARDITFQKRAEHTLRFLADASSALSALIDVEATLQKIAQLAATFFADWCVLFVADANGFLRQLPPAHADPSKAAWMQDWLLRYPLGRNEAYGPLHVWRTGRSELFEQIPDWFLADLAEDETHLEMMRELSPKSYMCVPIAAHEAPLGVMLFVAAQSGRRYDAADLSAAEDLARRAAVAIENARLYEELRDADRRKADLFAVLAHELRNSIAPIKYGLELQRLKELGPSVLATSQDAVNRQLEQMTRLIDDLLDISRISRGKIEIARDAVDLRATLHEAVEASRPLIDGRKQLLSVSVPDEELPVEGDPTKLRQVFMNLLNNAAKYSQAGGQIWLTAKRIDKTIEVRVRDLGIGIAREQLPHVFEMFAQAPQGARQAMGGLGIGLSLVRDLARLHGGTVEARSNGLGTGSEFIVSLPSSDESQSTAPASAPC